MRRPKLRCVMCQDMQTENCHRNRESVPKCALAVPAVCVLCETARSQNKKAKKKKSSATKAETLLRNRRNLRRDKMQDTVDMARCSHLSPRCTLIKAAPLILSTGILVDITKKDNTRVILTCIV